MLEENQVLNIFEADKLGKNSPIFKFHNHDDVLLCRDVNLLFELYLSNIHSGQIFVCPLCITL